MQSPTASMPPPPSRSNYHKSHSANDEATLTSSPAQYVPLDQSPGSRLATPLVGLANLIASPEDIVLLRKNAKWKAFSRCACLIIGSILFLGTCIFCVYLALMLSPPHWPASSEFTDKLFADIVWFAPNNQMNGKFDPSKSTLVFCHNRQPGSVIRRHLPSFNAKHTDPEHGPDINMADAWLDNGWNVGIFFWNQYADEIDASVAEAKVWTAFGPKRMRWLTSDGIWHHNDTEIRSVKDLLVESVLRHMKDFSGSDFRLVGHGLGAQLAAAGAYSLRTNDDIPANLRPTRLSLLDPYYTDEVTEYLEGSTGTMLFNTLRDLNAASAHRVAIDVYQCSFFQQLFGGPSMQLQDESVFVEVRFSFVNAFRIKAHHIACSNFYFLSYNNMELPIEVNWNGTILGHSAPSPRSASAHILQIQNLTHDHQTVVWRQISRSHAVTDSSNLKFQRQVASRLSQLSFTAPGITAIVLTVILLQAGFAVALFFTMFRGIRRRVRAALALTRIVFVD